ncbi:MAG: GTPase ObgE [Thermomicrobiales bacterium]
MLVDEAKIFVKAGNGGNGSASFRREKYAPMGGPDGGDGGRGGDVVLRVVDNLSSLLPFQYVNHYEAGNGNPGTSGRSYGKSGHHEIIKVPKGTVVFLDETGEQIADLLEAGEEFVVARGGKGGLGNVHFKSSTRQAPRIAELGEPGEQRWLRLELRLIADVGLVGLPNAGKSTLLASSTRARPKIADYPFTTLQPNLGVVEIGGKGGQAFVMADIPGLIEGAAGGAGLGHEFLRHVRRTKVLIHVLDAAGGLEGRDPLEDFRTINDELFSFDPTMRDKPMYVALNKTDLLEARENLPRLHEVLHGEGFQTFDISAATGDGLPDLFKAVAATLHEIQLAEAEARKREAERPKRRVYTIGNIDERAWEVEQTSAHHWVVTGVGIERFAKMTNFDQWESANRFQRVLERAGIFRELKRQGIKDGDIVHIAEFEMEWGDREEPSTLPQDNRRPSAIRRSLGKQEARDEAEEIDLDYEPGLEDADDEDALLFDLDALADEDDEIEDEDADFLTDDDDELVVVVAEQDEDGR